MTPQFVSVIYIAYSDVAQVKSYLYPGRYVGRQVIFLLRVGFRNYGSDTLSHHVKTVEINGCFLSASLPLLRIIAYNMRSFSIGTPPRRSPTTFVYSCFDSLSGRFAHDVIALTTFGIDVDSIGAAAEGNASPSYDAIESATWTLMELSLNPMKM